MAVAEIPATGSTVPSRQGQVWCTPSEAQRLLKFNTFSRQRPYRPWYAQYLAKEMEQDRFLPLTRIEFVEVDGKPVLVDGQHRLNAIVISGRPQILDVVYFEDCDQATLAEYYSRHDAGIPRSQGDRIKALGLAETVGVTQTQAMWAVSAMRIVLASFNGRVRGRLSPEDISTSVKAYRDGLHLFVRTIAGCPSEMITPLTRAATVSVALATCQDAPDAGHRPAAPTAGAAAGGPDGPGRPDPGSPPRSARRGEIHPGISGRS